ncbi:MAG: phosphotransferase family protein [Candidatus Thorarchaeota archaeon]
MMKYPLEMVHGLTRSKLQDLLEISCDAFDKSVSLEPISLGGWSNINIRGKSSGFEFVLKLPWITEEYEINPYDKLHDLSLFFSRLGLTAPPIEVGRLSDSSKTPFFLVEYVDGTTYSSIMDVSEDELLSLKDSHRLLKKQRPPNLLKYESPLDYLTSNHEPVENHSWFPRASKQTRTLIDHYDTLLPQVKSLNEVMGYWSRETMHGDLWLPNIVFHPERKAIFLDFEACAIGDSRYDLAYLLEVHVDRSTENIPILIEDKDIDFVNSLRPLVLAYVIDWSLSRLLSMESGIVEKNLNTQRIHTMILGYAREKIGRLKFLLH